MKIRPPGLGSIRTYATRLPQRPKFRHGDPLIDNPAAKVTLTSDGVTFIQRPPPTAPSPHSLTAAPVSPLLRPPTTSTASATDAATSSEGTIPPPLSQDRTFAHLSNEQIEEMRTLRLKDPAVWTRLRLARHFGCSPSFVGMFARLKKKDIREQKAKFEAQLEAGRTKWGEKRQLAEAIRRKRKEFW